MRFYFSSTFVALLMLLSAPAQADILNIKTVTSASGLKAWLVEDHTVPVISIRFMFRDAGAVNDPADKQGLSQIMSNTLDEGAGDLDSKAFQGKLNDHSISLGFQSSRDDFGGTVKTLSKYQDEAFDLLSLALTKPRVDKEPVGRMIESNLVRIRSNMTDPEWMNARLTNDVIYAGHPYAMNAGGTINSLSKITPDDLRAKFKTQFAKDNLIVAVAGDMTEQQVAGMLDKVFAQLPEKADIKKIDDVTFHGDAGVTVYQQKIPQTVINMVIPGIKHTDPDYHAAEVMDFVLGSSGFGSRLTEEVREKRGLTYGIYSSLAEMKHAGTLSIGTATRNDMTDEVIRISKDVMGSLTTAPITEKELKDAKSFLIGSVPLQLTSNDRISGIMIGLLSDDLPANYMEERAAAIEKLSVDDILRVSKRLLKTNNIKIILVGQPKMSDKYKVVTSLPNVE